MQILDYEKPSAYDAALARLIAGLTPPDEDEPDDPHHNEAQEDLLEFTRQTFRGFEESWHHQVLARYLTAFAKGQIRRLMVFMPPRHSKSEFVSRRLPAFIFGRNQNARIIAASYGADLALMMSKDVQNIMDSDEYQRVFPGVRAGGLNKKRTEGLFEVDNTEGDAVGYYRATGIGGGITGMGASYAIIDDPIKDHEEALSETHRRKVYNWYVSTLYPRLEDPGSVLLTMTRWHDDDLAGKLLDMAKKDPLADQWVVLKLPAVQNLPQPTDFDPREYGEPLWPARFPLERLASIKKTQDEAGGGWWEAMYGQQPSKPGGVIFKRDKFKFVAERPKEVVKRVRYWDMAATEGGGDYTVGTLLSMTRDGLYYVEDVVRGQWSEAEVNRVMKATAIMDGRNVAIREEQEPGASGKSVVRARKRTLLQAYDYKGVPKRSNKEVSWKPLAGQIEAGNVYLVVGYWNTDFVNELVTVPNAKNDDQTDSVSGAYNELVGKGALQQVKLQGFA